MLLSWNEIIAPVMIGSEVRLSPVRTGRHYTAKEAKPPYPVDFVIEAGDILRDCMHKRSKAVAWILLLGALILLLGVTIAASSFGFLDSPRPSGGVPLQVLTPTAAPEPVSQAGSTDGIWWMGLAIVVICLLPVITRRIFWS
jgi:hypothetical protein